jgi:hypothetical protein
MRENCSDWKLTIQSKMGEPGTQLLLTEYRLKKSRAACFLSDVGLSKSFPESKIVTIRDWEGSKGGSEGSKGFLDLFNACHIHVWKIIPNPNNM